MIDRSVLIGQEVKATTGFFDINGVPVLSIDTTQYPVYTVSDPDGNFVTAGVGTYSHNDNLYHCDFTIPTDAIISDANKYNISWNLLGVNGKEYINNEYFDVIHPTYNEASMKDQQILSLKNTTLNLSNAIPFNTAVTVELYRNDTLLATETASTNGMYSDYYIYDASFDETNFTLTGEYSVLWKFGTSVFYQKVNIIAISIMAKLSDMRMYLDKVAKDIDLYVGYRDSDLYFHLMKGQSIVNSLTPITDWTFQMINTQVTGASFGLDAAACWSALNAQYLAEGDSAFDYSGQPVTLTVDRTQYIESQLARMWDYLQGEFKEFKRAYMSLNQSFHLGLTYPSVGGNVNGINQTFRGIPFQPLLTRSW